MNDINRIPARGVGNAIRILRLLHLNYSRGLCLTDIVSLTKLDKSTVFRLMQRLLFESMVVRDKNKFYRLGPLLNQLQLGVVPDYGFLLSSSKALKRLASFTGCTVFFGIRAGSDIICLNRIEGDSPLRTLTRMPGDAYPLGVGAGGLAILAALSDDEIQTIIGDIEGKLYIYKLTKQFLLQKILETRQNRGVAFDNEIASSNVIGIGYPILNNNSSVASVFMTTEKKRINEEGKQVLIEKLKDCVESITTDSFMEEHDE